MRTDWHNFQHKTTNANIGATGRLIGMAFIFDLSIDTGVGEKFL
jgi:hypothetical protein